MAYTFASSASQSVTAGASVTALPLTMAAWFNRADLSANEVVLSLNATTGTNFYLMQVRSTGLVWFNINVGGALTAYNGSALHTANTWNHAAIVVGAANNRSIYSNGALDLNSTASNAEPSGINGTAIGARYASGVLGNFFNGLIAEVGVWNVALTDEEVASLAKGMTCDKVRPQSLVFYAPLVRDLIDKKGGLSITNNNGATVANHPRVYA